MFFLKFAITVVNIFRLSLEIIIQHTVADPGFPVGGRGPRRRGCGLPRQLRFENFVCQNERIGTLRGGARWAHPPRSANDIDFYVEDSKIPNTNN